MEEWLMSFRSRSSLSGHLKRSLLAQLSLNQARRSQSSEQGLTLIECLVAIIIITLTVVAITPPIFIATATRIQSRRAEQANQVAQAEIDRVRSVMERANFNVNELPAAIGTPANLDTGVAVATGGVAPGTIQSPAACPTTSYPPIGPTAVPIPATNLIPVDIDADCRPEFAMQVFRTTGCLPADLAALPTPPPPLAFTMGVRVYAYQEGEALPPLDRERATLALTTGKRDGGVAGQARKPLQVLTSKVTRSGSDRSIECATTNAPPGGL
jgi:type II secretory pathway pseudopilin PulG